MGALRCSTQHHYNRRGLKPLATLPDPNRLLPCRDGLLPMRLRAPTALLLLLLRLPLHARGVCSVRDRCCCCCPGATRGKPDSAQPACCFPPSA